MRKVRRALVLLIMLACLSGCGWMNPHSAPTASNPSGQELLDQVMAHLKQKYNVEFEAYGWKVWNAQQGGRLMVYVPGTNPKLNFEVDVTFDGDGGTTIQDGYVGLLMKPLIRQRFLDVVNHYYPVAEVQARNPGMASVFPESMNQDTTFADFLEYVCSDPGSVFGDIYFVVPEGETEDQSVQNINAIVSDIKTAFPPQCVTNSMFSGYSAQAYEESVVDDPAGARDTNNDGYSSSNVSFMYYWTTSEIELRKVR